MLDCALRQLKTWTAQGLDIPLSVNISAANLQEADFALQVQLAVMKHGIWPGSLELELTESAVM